MGFLGGLVLKNLAANARDTRDKGLIPGWERSPGGGNGNPLQYSYLGSPMDRGAWWATVHGVTNSHTGQDLATQQQVFTCMVVLQGVNLFTRMDSEATPNTD